MDFKSLLSTPEYDFLKTNTRLGKRIMLLGVSGSYGYGTNREGSDVDLRGATLNLPSDLIGLTSFEQYEDDHTDTVIFAFNKLVRLLLNCNPNTIEILGLDDDQYLIRSEPGEEFLKNRSLFLTKRAAASFGHYADAQLRRLENAIARDHLPQPSKEQHILRSVIHAMEDFNRRHGGAVNNLTGAAEGKGREAEENALSSQARLYIDDAVTAGLEKEIFMDADFRHVPLRNFNEMSGVLNSVVRDYDKAGQREHRKDDNHLNKHAMHLVRLYMMGIDILGKGEIRTRRHGEDLKLLISIRSGDYMKDGELVPEFFEIVSDYQKKFEEAEKKSVLPEEPDMERIGRFAESINRRVVMEDI